MIALLIAIAAKGQARIKIMAEEKAIIMMISFVIHLKEYLIYIKLIQAISFRLAK